MSESRGLHPKSFRSKKLIDHLILDGLKNMAYLLSLLETESSVEGSENLLCYYINDAANIQIIRLMDGAMCLSEHIIYSGEGILFTASAESYLEIYSPRINRTKVSIISCKRLRINEVSNLTKSVARKYSNPI